MWHFAAALFAAAVVIGGPVALLSRGSPLPARLPTWSTFFMDLQSRNIPNSFWWKSATLFGWIAWVFLSYDILAELAHQLRNRNERRSSMLGPLNALVSKLVAAAVVSVPVGWRPLAGAGAAVQPVALSGPVVEEAGPAPVPVPPGTDQTTSQSPLPTYVVQRGDTLWGIAQRDLGNPLRWSEIWELNQGRQMGDGIFSDPHWIYPGWSLVLPADANGEGVQLPTPGTATATRQSPPAPEAASPATTPPRPSPPVAALRPEARATGGASRARESPAPRRTRVGEIRERPTQDAKSSALQTGVEVGAATVIGGALLGLLGRGLVRELALRRRRQQRRAGLGRRIPLPTDDLASVEIALYPTDDRDASRWVDLGVRLLGQRLREMNEAPVVLGLRVAHDALEFFVNDGAPDPPSPFIYADGRWRLGRSGETERLLQEAEGYPAVLPGLVSVGSDDAGPLLLNLESGGLVAVEGDPVSARETVLAMAVELAGCAWVDSLDLFGVGIDVDLGLDRLEQVRHLSEVSGAIRHQLLAQTHNLEGSRQPSAQQARLLRPEERLCPLVVLCANQVSQGDIEALCLPEDPGRLATCLVVAGEVEGANWRLAARPGGELEIPALGVTVRSQRLTGRDVSAIEALLRLACEERDVAVDDPPYDAISDPFPVPATSPPETASPEQPEADTGDLADLDLHSERLTQAQNGRRTESAGTREATAAPEDTRDEPSLLLVGATELRGGRPTGRVRSKVVELIAWLHLHPEGGDPQEIALKLWPNKMVAESYIWDIANQARRLLGPRSDGEPRITRWEKLRLDPPLESDWSRIAHLTHAENPEAWLAALELVRGQPFQGSDWPWAVVEGFASNMVGEIVDAACKAATWALQHDQPERASHAVEQCFLLGDMVTFDQRLWRLAMRPAARLGGSVAVRAVMERLKKALEAELCESDLIEPETQALYDALKRDPDIALRDDDAHFSSAPETNVRRRMA